MLGTGKKKGESWNRREGQTEEENRPWWLAKLSSKGKGIQVSKVGHSNTGSASNMLAIHNRTLRMNSRSVDEREILINIGRHGFLSSVQACTQLKHIETDIGLPSLLDVHISPIKN
jgi:hypothetical protein